ITVAALADHLAVSPTHLATLFKGTVGESPHSYMTRLKLDDCVRTLIMEPDVPVYVLRRRYGWRDERHFRRLLKRYIGRTPRELVQSRAHTVGGERTVERWVVFNERYPCNGTTLLWLE